MENASKALIMAAGILIGVLLLALMVTLFASASDTFSSYEQTKKSEAIQQFNVNFTKFLGQDLTIHQVVTICNFAKKENNKIQEVTVTGGTYTVSDIESDVSSYPQEDMPKYKLQINSYSNEGYISSISFQ